MLGFKSEPNKNYAVESITKFLKIQLQARSKLWSGFFFCWNRHYSLSTHTEK